MRVIQTRKVRSVWIEALCANDAVKSGNQVSSDGKRFGYGKYYTLSVQLAILRVILRLTRED